MELLFFVFIFFYPLFMAVYWITGSLLFFFRWEGQRTAPVLKEHPLVALLVPCHNEETSVRDVIHQIAANQYPNFEIVAINDGSTDQTGAILDELASRIPQLKVVTLTRNYGKAAALRMGVMATSAEFVMCIDADALLEKDALFWMVKHFQDGPRVGAVTGNPRVVNNRSLLGRVQIGEFSAIVGMVKRTQRSVGRVFTVSGVNAMFRVAALHDVGYWSSETVTEDIDISWKLQLRRWDIRFEPRAVTWILVPEDFRALWKQRLRWAQGGYEAAVKFGGDIFRWENRRMWIVGMEYWISVLWCYALMFTVFCWAATNTLPEDAWPEILRVPTMVPGWTGVILATACLLQFTVGLLIDRQYEKRGLLKHMFWAIWYPAIYWFLSAATTVVAVPKGMLKRRQREKYARWVSPVRALITTPQWLTERRKKEDHRSNFWRMIPNPKKALETVIMVVSWTMWVYLVVPLVSLLLWASGVFLFMDRMINPAGYAAILTAYGYAAAILTMWGALAAWILWNQRRYGRRNRRSATLPAVSVEQMSSRLGVPAIDVERVRLGKRIALHLDESDRPVIESVAPGHIVSLGSAAAT
jgi:biofilm PGA synthesis N-glycosyltransferase PgaC